MRLSGEIEHSTSLARPRVALVNSIAAANDAISASVRDTYRALVKDQAFVVTLFCYKNDYPEIHAQEVSSIGELLLSRDYLDADIIVWHFGVYYELFNATLVGNGHAPRVVHFHNVTPKQFVPKRFWKTIDQSLIQLSLLRFVEEIWAVSTVNAEAACEVGVERNKIYTVPLVVEDGIVTGLSDKEAELITVLFVGRFVPSKGVLELLQAVKILCERGTSVRFELELVGNVDFSDPDYVLQVRDFVEENSLGDIVTMHGTVDDAALRALYRKAHVLAIPSYHEGFCKPVVEALRAGCIPVGYASYNLPHVANGFGRMVQPGDIEALSTALREMVEALPEAIRSPTKAQLSIDRGIMNVHSLSVEIGCYVKQFSAGRIGDVIRQRLHDLISANTSQRE